MLNSMIMYFRMTLELYGRTIRVNLAKPMKMKEGATRAGKNNINAYLPTVKKMRNAHLKNTNFYTKIRRPFVLVDTTQSGVTKLGLSPDCASGQKMCVSRSHIADVTAPEPNTCDVMAM